MVGENNINSLVNGVRTDLTLFNEKAFQLRPTTHFAAIAKGPCVVKGRRGLRGMGGVNK